MFNRKSNTTEFVFSMIFVLLCTIIVESNVSAMPVPPKTQLLKQQNLDGNWNIVKDESDVGLTKQWYIRNKYPVTQSVEIPVPGNIWEALPYYVDKYSWYSRTFTPEIQLVSNMKYYLRFTAVQYLCKVWLNGIYLGEHEGGEEPFEFDATSSLVRGENFVAVRVYNTSNTKSYPVAYVMGGIVGHVSLAVQPKVRIVDVFAQPDIKNGNINLSITLENNSGSAAAVKLRAIYGVHNGSNLGTVTSKLNISTGQSVKTMTVTISSPYLWSPDNPYLYTVNVTSDWGDKHDEYLVHHVGFKDFRITNGILYTKPYFHLNNQRIYLKSTHGNVYDPRYIHGTSRDISIMDKELHNLKTCGFNMFRSISLALIPELLDLADEIGIMIWEEHAGSWFMTNTSKFVPSLSSVVKRDRNHPSIAIWGFLNENTALVDTAIAFLPVLRKNFDNTRLVCLGSGRFDQEATQASFSNPGSSTWDAYIGGEDPTTPVQSFNVPDQFSFPPERYLSTSVGDIHTYSNWPVNWDYQTNFAKIGANTKPLILSEAGVGSLYDPVSERAMLIQAGVPKTIQSWEWAGPWSENFENAWNKYGLYETYPVITEMFMDSQKSQARQRVQQLSMVRGNPNIMGFNTTGHTDPWGYAEGIMDNFGNMKADLTPAMQNGWAKLRWCLTVNPMSIYTNSTFRVKVELANEDFLTANTYPAILEIKNPGGTTLWTRNVNIKIPSSDAPLAYYVMNEDITVTGLAEGEYTLTAELTGITNAAAGTLKFNVFSSSNHPIISGQVSVLGVNQVIKELISGRGATLHEYNAAEEINNEAIIVGDVTNDAATWRSLYAKAAKGAHIIFLDKNVFSNGSNPNKWIAVPDKGKQQSELSRDLYHHEFVAKNHVIFNTLKIKVLTPDLYEQMLRCRYLTDITTPDDVVAVGFHTGEGGYSDGIMIGTYNHYAGKFTINMINLTDNAGKPVVDRMILNMTNLAKSDAAAIQPLPSNYETELDNLGIKE